MLGYKGWKKIRYSCTVKNLGNFGTAKRTGEGGDTPTMKQRCLQAPKGFNIDPAGFSWAAAAKRCTQRTCSVTVLSGTLVLLAHWWLKHQIWANKLSQRAEHSAAILGGRAYIKPAADVLQNTRFRLTVWGAGAGVGQEGWKISLSSALLKGMQSHAPHPKCQIHQMPVAAQLRLCCPLNLCTPTQPESDPVAIHSCSHCPNSDPPWLQTHSTWHVLLCTGRHFRL